MPPLQTAGFKNMDKQHLDEGNINALPKPQQQNTFPPPEETNGFDLKEISESQESSIFFFIAELALVAIMSISCYVMTIIDGILERTLNAANIQYIEMIEGIAESVFLLSSLVLPPLYIICSLLLLCCYFILLISMKKNIVKIICHVLVSPCILLVTSCIIEWDFSALLHFFVPGYFHLLFLIHIPFMIITFKQAGNVIKHKGNVTLTLFKTVVN